MDERETDDRSAKIHWAQSSMSQSDLYFIFMQGTKIAECWNRFSADILVKALRLDQEFYRPHSAAPMEQPAADPVTGREWQSISDDKLAGWARNWHWNDCAEDKPVDPSIYFRDKRLLKAFIAEFSPTSPDKAKETP